MKDYCGLDFGTSNSAIGQLGSDGVELAEFDGKSYLPSAVFFDYASDAMHFGEDGIRRYMDGYEGRMMWSPKNALGTSLMDEKTRLNTKMVSFRHIIQAIIGNLKNQAEKQFGEEKSKIVCGRPVHFNDRNEELDRASQKILEEILLDIGFKDVEFEFEPISAAINYQQRLKEDATVLVVDMGGGTSDFSVVQLPKKQKGILDKNLILSVGGVHIAGTDLDKSLSLSSVMPHFGSMGHYRSMEGKMIGLPSEVYHNLATRHKIHFAYTREQIEDVRLKAMNSDVRPELNRLHNLLRDHLGHSLSKEVEGVKINLSTEQSSHLHFRELDDPLDIKIERGDFDQSIRGQTEEIRKELLRTVRNSGLKPSSIDHIFMTGGTSMVPSIRVAIGECLPFAKMIDGDTFGSVASGLTLRADHIYK